MYRAFTFLTLEAGHDPFSRERIRQLLAKVDFHAEIRDGEMVLREGQRDLAPYTRLPEVNAAVSPVSSLPELREYLVNIQRKLRLSAAAGHGRPRYRHRGLFRQPSQVLH